NCMTLDGKISTNIGDRDWIICDESRTLLHELRGSYDAVLVGVNTILQDNPQLNCKLPGGRDPVKVVVDSMARTPVNSKIFIKNNNEDYKPNVLIAVSKEAREDRVRALQAAGAEIIVCSDEKAEHLTESKVNIKKLIYC